MDTRMKRLRRFFHSVPIEGMSANAFRRSYHPRPRIPGVAWQLERHATPG